MNTLAAAAQWATDNLPTLFGDIEIGRNGLDAVAEVMRRINYPIKSALPGCMFVRTSGDLKDPKEARKLYRNVAAGLKEDRLKQLRHPTRCPQPAKKPVVAQRPAEPDQTLDALIGKLLERSPPDQEEWAVW
ncbi:hypothetical protein AB3X91_37760 [Paraburkholderia sp. BR14263]|uniref:hypothetical protein n=1 Tax=unclassified Paraburkholderia TaxID=2615204 RepID=UPI0034CE3399